jgi:putative tricarboxylic transport membrane protein
MLKRLAAALLGAALLASGNAPAFAWPDKPVKVIVPFGPGGTTDVVGRLLQRVVQEKLLLPQPLTIINVGGHFSVGSIQAKNAARSSTRPAPCPIGTSSPWR